MTAAEQLRALHPGKALSILALSSGGAAGAFGAGAVAGLTRSDSRPDFAVVTGVSVGALVAPYAFLGPTWDARLLDAFTGGAGEDLLHLRGLGAIFGSSLYRGAPLKQLVDAYVSDAMIQAVALEAVKGRLLLVATTDVATGKPVVWDLGSIARNGGPDAKTLFRNVLVASASVPGMFLPVVIPVRADGGRFSSTPTNARKTGGSGRRLRTPKTISDTTWRGGYADSSVSCQRPVDRVYRLALNNHALPSHATKPR